VKQNVNNKSDNKESNMRPTTKSVLYGVCLLFAAHHAFCAEKNGTNGNDKVTMIAISYNIMKFEGYPQTTRWQGNPSYESDETILRRVRSQLPLRIAFELELYNPDIISLQEATDEKKVAQIAAYLGMEYVFFPGNGRWPGAILTKYKIVDSQAIPIVGGNCPPELFTRHWGRVVVETENGQIVINTAHLHPSDSKIRKREISEIIKSADLDIKANRSVLVMGDLNHKDNDPEYKYWVDAGLTDTMTAAGIGAKYSAPSTCPMRRADYIWSYGPITKKLAESRILFRGNFKMGYNDPVPYFTFSDHLPVMAIFMNSFE